MHDVCAWLHVRGVGTEDSVEYSVLFFSNRVDGSFFSITSSLTWVSDLKPRPTRLVSQAPLPTGASCLDVCAHVGRRKSSIKTRNLQSWVAVGT